MKQIPSSQFLSFIPLSESDRLLHSWGFDLTKEYFSIVSRLDLTTPVVVELATGSGRMSAVLSGLFPVVLTGDYSLSDHARAVKRIPPQFLGRVQFVQLTMEVLPFRSNSIPLIVCMNTLHEVQQPMQCINEMFRVLSPKGTIVLGDFNNTGFSAMKTIHEIVYHDVHTEGCITMKEIYSVTKETFARIEEIETPLNYTLIASYKRTATSFAKNF